MPIPNSRVADVPSGRASRGAVRVAGVARTFPTPAPLPVLRGVDLTLAPGEIVAVVGPSGCGKSTLLRLLAGLDTPTSGVIELDAAPVRDTDERTAVAFQEPRLLPWRTIADNVALGLPRGIRGSERRDRVAELLDLVGLSHAADRRPREVSGGMAQRTSLARALARGPEVLLLDEPFGALDALTRLRMQDLLLQIHAARPTTVLLVTHDVEEALYLADRVLLLRSLDDSAASSIARIVEVPGSRPRDRAAHDFTALRAELLEGLGVDTHHSTPDIRTPAEEIR
ncbi:ABC transporter ATP-binding protein [Microbacterium sp. ET2]|uniref:ABC transporter ATP-binding protein n=1 Tax=Microbacterium albipurpureum TaxID=3050384 RepID=UPI00259C9B1E|nr:ABC transporter ATP-binding protein [Microbacterium sp. ET2 (Ac-2212)]WJL95586.1 ABC transporter ATP-binding protein [Microbacterium sp. ET2 (Ac-2212)]